MRSFSNIMPNFADNLHLLVDSILFLFSTLAAHFSAQLFCAYTNFQYLCTRHIDTQLAFSYLFSKDPKRRKFTVITSRMDKMDAHVMRGLDLSCM